MQCRQNRLQKRSYWHKLHIFFEAFRLSDLPIKDCLDTVRPADLSKAYTLNGRVADSMCFLKLARATPHTKLAAVPACIQRHVSERYF